jgi:hypothetical protein
MRYRSTMASVHVTPVVTQATADPSSENGGTALRDGAGMKGTALCAAE